MIATILAIVVVVLLGLSLPFLFVLIGKYADWVFSKFDV